MESEEDKNKKEKTEEEILNEGPLSLLKEAVRTNSQILIYCRNNRKLLGRIRAFDRHMNIILEAVCEIWSEMMKGKNKQHKLRNRERFISKMFLRGDSIILIVKNPNDTKTEGEKKIKEKKEKEKKKENEEKEKENEKGKKDNNDGIKLDEDQKSDEEEKEKIPEDKKGKKKKKYEEKYNSSEEDTEKEKELRNKKRRQNKEKI